MIKPGNTKSKMKKHIRFLIACLGSIVFLFSCEKKPKEKGNEGFQNPFAKPCECNKTLQNDSITTFYATNLVNSDQKISINCLDVEVAIAEMISKDGNPYCENLYHLKCISNTKHHFPLTSDFYYSSERATDSLLENGNSVETLNLQLQKKKQALYEISLNEKREISQITFLKYWDEN